MNYYLDSREAFCLRMFLIILLLRETAGMRLRRAYAGQLRQKIHNGTSIREKFSCYSCHFSLCNLGESVKKSKNGCVVCGRKSQPRKFQKVKAYTNDFESCFKIVKAIDENEDICEGCRRAVKEHRRTGKLFHHL